jgi:hypothetical protein
VSGTLRARGWIVVLGLLVLARLTFIALVPDALSVDASAYVRVARLLEEGRNPYNESNILCWPPFWMQGIYALDRIALATGIPYIRVHQAFLVGVDGVIASVLLLVLWRLFSHEGRDRLVLVGLALNPVSILVTCAHANVESVTGLWPLVAASFLVAWRRSSDPVHWLLACLAVGAGALEKTVPLVLAPLLLVGWEKLRPLARLLGLILVVGPAGLGLSVVYVLGPSQVLEHVVHYRSVPGYFGFTGLLHLLHADGLMVHWTKVFLLVLGATGLFVGRLALRGRLDAGRIVLGAFLLMGCVPIFGPGFGPQYACLVLPVLVLSHALVEGRWRRLLLVAHAVAAGTYSLEYALTPALGAWLLRLHSSEALERAGATFASREAQTLVRAPLFLVLLLLFAEAVRHLAREAPPETAR